jgi:hypothetical protein
MEITALIQTTTPIEGLVAVFAFEPVPASLCYNASDDEGRINQ